MDNLCCYRLFYCIVVDFFCLALKATAFNNAVGSVEQKRQKLKTK